MRRERRGASAGETPAGYVAPLIVDRHHWWPRKRKWSVWSPGFVPHLLFCPDFRNRDSALGAPVAETTVDEPRYDWTVVPLIDRQSAHFLRGASIATLLLVLIAPDATVGFPVLQQPRLFEQRLSNDVRCVVTVETGRTETR